MLKIQKIVRCNPTKNRVIPVLNKKEYFERKSAHSVCEPAGTLLTLSKQSSGQTHNHTKGILTYARIMVTTAGFEPISPSPVTWRVPYSMSPCVCLVGISEREPDKTAKRELLDLSPWLRRLNLNQRPQGYEPCELPTAPLRYMSKFLLRNNAGTPTERKRYMENLSSLLLYLKARV